MGWAGSFKLETAASKLFDSKAALRVAISPYPDSEGAWLNAHDAADIFATTSEVVLFALSMAAQVSDVGVVAPRASIGSPSPDAARSLHDLSMVWMYTILCLDAERRGHSSLRPRVSLLTAGVAGPDHKDASNLDPCAQALALGVSRTLFMEERAVYGVSIDMDCAPELTLDRLGALARDGRYVVACRGSLLYQEVLAPSASVAPVATPGPRLAAILRGKTVVITGGLRGLGLALAKQLARCTSVRSLVLTGRTAEGPAVDQAVGQVLEHCPSGECVCV